jgi:membrane protein DedA with SNARE-associated domain
MTIGWAIIIVTAVYFLDKHHRLKKALLMVGMLALLLVAAFTMVVACRWLNERWQAHQFVSAG